MTVSLDNYLKEKYPDIEGTYTIDEEQMVNNKENWLQSNGENAIWYTNTSNAWNIGPKKFLGTPIPGIYGMISTDNSLGAILPHQVNHWKYWNKDHWTTSNNVNVMGFDFVT